LIILKKLQSASAIFMSHRRVKSIPSKLLTKKTNAAAYAMPLTLVRVMIPKDNWVDLVQSWVKSM